MHDADIGEILSHFALTGALSAAAPYGDGHINDTYLLEIADEKQMRRCILQRINRHVFPRPDKLMENFSRVTRHLQQKISAGNLPIKTIELIRSEHRLPFYLDADGDFWRLYHFVDQVKVLKTLSSTDQAYRVAKGFGEFQNLLTDLPGPRLYETIADFHNTPKRFADLRKAIDAKA